MIKDIIYKYATSSIDGLPAIPEKRFNDLKNELNETFKNDIFWKQRCQYAEILLDPTYSENTKSEIYKKWNELKNKL